MDFEASSRCFPGVESFARLPDGRFEGVINVSVGPLKASLRGHAWFVESVAPERFAAVARVCDPLTRSDISVEVDGTLTELASDKTYLRYGMLIKLISVPLAQVAYPLIRANANRLNDELVRRLQSCFPSG